jgi:hypothetical protein
MKTSYIAVLFCVVCLTSCHSQEKSDSTLKLKNQDISISLKFYPTGVVDDVRYSIYIINDSLIVENHTVNKKSVYKTKLSNIQINDIDTLSSTIKTQCRSSDIVEDAWAVTLVINNKIVYEVNDFSFESPPNEIKNLINYLVSLSPIKIDLYGFS